MSTRQKADTKKYYSVDQTPSGILRRDQRRMYEYNAPKAEQTKDCNNYVEVVDKAKSAARNPPEKTEKRKQRDFERAKSWREGKKPQQQKPDFKACKETPEVVSPMCINIVLEMSTRQKADTKKYYSVDQTPSGILRRNQRRMYEYNAAKAEQTKDWNKYVEVVDKAKSAARNPPEKTEKRKQRDFERAKSWREGKKPQQQKPDFKACKETPEVVSPMYNVGPIIHGLTPLWHTKLP